MTDPLLQTKLHIPPLRPSLVPRARLIDKLNAGLDGKLTLVTAPAGFGKTTLIADWGLGIADSKVIPQSAFRNPPSFCWLTLDNNDNDLRRFLAYVVAACQRALPGFGPNLAHLLQLPERELAWDHVLTAVLNEFSHLNNPVILVLDDYQHIQSAAIHEALAFWLEHIPPTLHLVITSRQEPPLPLSRLRARGQLTEIGLNELRFTSEEADTFLRSMMKLPLSASDATVLADRAEGWPAGLQLAALALQSAGPETADTAAFVTAFSGSNRLVLEYLTDEVLAHQPASTREFLLQTAVLDRFCAPLCAAVLADDRETAVSSQAMLEGLDAANLFIMPLDHQRRWYRYHTLFADLLRDRLVRFHPEKLPVLHGRARRWWAENGFAAEAIAHAFAAGEESAAAQLIAHHAQEMIGRGEVIALLGWLKKLSPSALGSRPRLLISLALARLLAGQFTDLTPVLTPLQEAQTLLQTSDRPEKSRLLAEVNVVRAVVLVEQGETEAGLALAEPAARQLKADESQYGRYLAGLLATTMGLAYRDQGKTEAAVRAYERASQNRDLVMITLLAAYERGKLLQEMGQLLEAERVHREAMSWVKAQFGAGAAALPLSGAAHIGLGRLLSEWNQLEEARHHLETGIERARQKGGLGIDRDGLLALALVCQAQGSSEEAIALMAQAIDHARRSPRPDATLRAAAYQVRLWLAQSNLPAAARWAGEQAPHLGHLAYPAEVTGTALARIHLEQQRPKQALAVLEPFLPVVEAGGRNGRLLEMRFLQALAHNQLGATNAALSALERSLALAEPEGYVRLFLVLGQPVMKLLYTAVQQQIMPDYASRLLALFTDQQEPPQQTDRTELIEVLSERELEVLHLVAIGLTNREIGLRLHLSPNTVKRHTLNIYEKLGVHSRTEAVAKARFLSILR